MRQESADFWRISAKRGSFWLINKSDAARNDHFLQHHLISGVIPA